LQPGQACSAARGACWRARHPRKGGPPFASGESRVAVRPMVRNKHRSLTQAPAARKMHPRLSRRHLPSGAGRAFLMAEPLTPC
jgi:hypothetical protein